MQKASKFNFWLKLTLAVNDLIFHFFHALVEKNAVLSTGTSVSLLYLFSLFVLLTNYKNRTYLYYFLILLSSVAP